MKNLVKNLIIFVLLIIITFLIIFKDQDINELLNVMVGVNKIYILLAIISMFFYFIFEAMDVKMILAQLNQKVKFINMLRYSFVGFFFSGITPSASGGQPMEIYYMHKDGIKASYSTVSLLVHLICYQSLTIICGIIGLIINYDLMKDGLIWLFVVGTSLNFIALITMLICLFSYSLAKKVVGIIVKILNKIPLKKIPTIIETLENTLENYKESSKIIKKHKKIFMKAFLLVLGQVISYYTVTFFVYKSFGFNNITYFELVSIQAMLYITVSSIPLPGAVGVSEASFLGIYGGIFGSKYLSGATILNRMCNFYLFIVLGLISTLVSFIKIERSKNEV